MLIRTFYFFIVFLIFSYFTSVTFVACNTKPSRTDVDSTKTTTDFSKLDSIVRNNDSLLKRISLLDSVNRSLIDNSEPIIKIRYVKELVTDTIYKKDTIRVVKEVTTVLRDTVYIVETDSSRYR